MYWCAITGGIASGKSSLRQFLLDKHYLVLSADDIAHQLLQKNSEAYYQVMQAFGIGILSPDKSIDRKRLGEIVFSSKTQKSILEKILHPKIRQVALRQRREWEQQGHSIAFYEVPLLFETKQEKDFDRVVVVYAPEAKLLSRLQRNRGLSELEAKQRLAAQLPIEQKRLLADYLVDNSSDKVSFTVLAEEFLHNLKVDLQLGEKGEEFF